MGRFPIGTNAFGKSSGVDVKVFKEIPGPHKMSAWKSGEIGDLVGMVSNCSRTL